MVARFGVMQRNAWPRIVEFDSLEALSQEAVGIKGPDLAAMKRLAGLVEEVRHFLPSISTLSGISSAHAIVYWCENSKKPCIFFELPGPLWETQMVVCPLDSHAGYCSEQDASSELWDYVSDWWEQVGRGRSRCED